MIWGIVLCFALGAATQGYFAWKQRARRECWVSLGLGAAGVLFAALYAADANRFDILRVLERLFRPLTDWMYNLL